MTARPHILPTLPRSRAQAICFAIALAIMLSGTASSFAETVFQRGGEIKTSGFRYPFPEPLPEQEQEQDAPPRIERTTKPAPVSTDRPSATFGYPSKQYPGHPYPKSNTQPFEHQGTQTPSPEATALPAPSSMPEAEALPPITARVAIIIDDIGYSLKQGLRSARFPAPLTLAILPHTPNGLALAELGFDEGKAIMLHAPMSNVKQSQLDPGGLTGDMAEEEFIRTLRANIDAVPHIIGINNHMGSYLTQLSKPMNWLMGELKRQQLFFVDSRTSADSQAWEVAQQHGLSSHKRDVFLDHERDNESIERQFERMVQLAKRRGTALAIGHPYPETLAVLEREIPRLRRQGIELVSIEHLLTKQPAIVQSDPPAPATTTTTTTTLATSELLSPSPL